MFRMYFEYAKKSFQNSIVYRMETILGILNTVISIFVYTAIWTSLFKFNGTIEGYDLKMVSTHFVISMGLSAIFANMTGEISWKVISGEIASDLLRPIGFTSLVLSKTIGTIICRLVIQFIPAFVISYFAIGILLPHSMISLLLFLISIIFGFLIFYFLDLIVSVSAFWFHHIFFIEQFKDAIIAVLSGALLPIWFLPKFLANIIKATPFESLYYIPVSIYLGKLNTQEIITGMLKQFGWIIILGIVSQLIWKAGIKKLVIQGG